MTATVHSGLYPQQRGEDVVFCEGKNHTTSMGQVLLGRTGITVEKNGFGALPIQRVSTEYAGMLLKKAIAAGMTYIDSARGYSDSEEKIGKVLAQLTPEERSKLTIATKSPSDYVEGFWKDLDESLSLLGVDCIDIFQFHNPARVYRPGDDTGKYDAMLKAREQGKIRYIGFTNHRLDLAFEAVESGLYDTLQFPFSYLSGEREIELVKLCKEKGVGFIAMKALAGGLITNSAAAYAWLNQFDNVLPIWGVQRETEVDEFISYIDNPPALTPELEQVIEADRGDLLGDFCRGCGYCMPCPVGIQIHMCARMGQILRRSPSEDLLMEGAQEMMAKIEDCIHCGQCTAHCPYELDTPTLLARQLEDYRNVLAGKASVN